MTQASKNGSERPCPAFLIFDIETAPDMTLLDQYYSLRSENSVVDESHIWKDTSLLEILATREKITFPGFIFHTVVSICALYIHPETHQIIDGFRKTIRDPSNYLDLMEKEKVLLTEFWKFSVKYRDVHKIWYDSLQSDSRMSDFQRKKLRPIPVTFCGYNISGFDLPVIEHRSIKHKLTCSIPEYGKEFGYDSYRSKFALDKSYDLYAFLNQAGRGAAGGLQAMALSLGLAGKLEGMEGSQVASEFYEKRDFGKIEDYCAVDVLITYGVFLAVQKFRGIIDNDTFKESVNALGIFLNQAGKPPQYRELYLKSPGFFASK